jgi:hypothetical protein
MMPDCHDTDNTEVNCYIEPASDDDEESSEELGEDEE